MKLRLLAPEERNIYRNGKQLIPSSVRSEMCQMPLLTEFAGNRSQRFYKHYAPMALRNPNSSAGSRLSELRAGYVMIGIVVWHAMLLILSGPSSSSIWATRPPAVALAAASSRYRRDLQYVQRS